MNQFVIQLGPFFRFIRSITAASVAFFAATFVAVEGHGDGLSGDCVQCMQIADAGQAVSEEDQKTKKDATDKSQKETSQEPESSKGDQPESKKPESKKLGDREPESEIADRVMPQGGSGFINDQAVQVLVEAKVNRLIKSGKATTLGELQKQLGKTSCRMDLNPVSKTLVNSEMLYLNQRKSVVAVMISRKHNDHWHATMAATGFMISEDGAMVTNRHVVHATGTLLDEYMFVMTSDAKVYPVQGVLASNKVNDAAICQVEGSGFQALSLRPNTPVGAPVRIISHPQGRLYTLTEGIVSRRHTKGAVKRKHRDEEIAKLDLSKTTKWVTVTADFGKGSSGAPVFDRYGNVIGVATMTNNLTVEKNDDAITQMVFRDCFPAEVVLKMIKSSETP